MNSTNSFFKENGHLNIDMVKWFTGLTNTSYHAYSSLSIVNKPKDVTYHSWLVDRSEGDYGGSLRIPNLYSADPHSKGFKKTSIRPKFSPFSEGLPRDVEKIG